MTAVIILLTPPTYTGKVTLLIERNTSQVLNFLEVLGEQRDSETYDFYKTQYEILKSRTLAARVLREQRLEDSSLFTNRYQPGILARLWMHATRRAEDDVPTQTTVAAEDHPGEESDAIQAYLAMLLIRA